MDQNKPANEIYSQITYTPEYKDINKNHSNKYNVVLNNYTFRN